MQAQMLAWIAQFFAQFAGNIAGVDTGVRPRPEAVYERFRKMDPKEFSGTTDPVIAEGWIKSIEVIFTFMELQDADRVICATFLLAGDAKLWWESASVLVNLQTLTWEGFNEGDNNVTEFVRKFERGCHFVPLITNDSREKLRHFIDGLRQVLRHDFRVAGPTIYAVAVSRALGQQGKRPFQGPLKDKGLITENKAPQKPGEYPWCPKCKRQHMGQCLWGSGKCFKCGASDHMLKDCPQ
ncbi:uncharacterized protein [Primulina huaijiensis]|uniref:uncharacterized protein n=1 Tax=Primulina huaijiensis TaxID=1492673 RepID=UPI003CC73959